jgi:dTDP-glucose 4,6-dehydratase
MTKKVIVTGGAGFIGSHLVKKIKKTTDWDVIVIDALTYAGSLKNLNEGDQDFHLIDIRKNSRLLNLVDDDVDAIFHLAAESHVDRSIEDPLTFVQTNVIGTVNMLELGLKYFAKNPDFKFYHISTDEVFGSLEMNDRPFNEETPYDPRSPYSASKASSDHFVRAYHHTYNLPILISNCSNNYGTHQYPEKLIPVVINSIKNNKPIPIYGNGGNVRDWLHVEDHAEAILSIYNKGRIGETYCIGGNMELSNYELVHAICDICENIYGGNPRGLITYVEDRKGHDLRYAIDPYKLKRELGWEPQHGSYAGLIEGLTETIKWYMSKK